MDKIIIITGSYPPDPCGVGDYTQKIVEELKKDKKINIEVLKIGKFNLKESYNTFKYLNKHKNTIKLLQYPTLGYGWSILPQILSLFFSKNMYINLHEFSQRKFKARLASSIFFLSKAHIIFTTQDERIYALKKFKFLEKRSSIINIASNIEFICEKAENKKIYDLLNFGIIMPNKGLEDFFYLVKKLREEKFDGKILLVGRKQKENLNYFNEIVKICKRYDVELKVDMDDVSVAKEISKSKVAYLPFPDGVTFRRGSFLACLGNEVKVLTYPNVKSYDFNEIKVLCEIIEKKEDSVQAYKTLLYKKNTIFDSQEYNAFLEKFNWKSVIKKFKKLMLTEESKSKE
ncbi:hypothetical protein MKD34_00795 [Cetobacterium somerae]|uniref:hypothetical protein n=1 Tax=Cetobacterium somerae TaxID=188913 RepID=UPI001F065088|nr:hypothetical protein [Cetobacterium somerae]UPO97405.1 hypothetical protein MKD34_00795 [Cetobacterium somerae]